MSDTPFWKKEISLRRKPKEAKPEVAATPEVQAKPESTPFWKKEISLARKPKAAKPKTAKAPKAPKAAKPKPESAPFWKKEISLARKPKEAKPKVDTSWLEPGFEQADAPKTKAKPETTPFWKKEVSLGKKRAPKVHEPEPEPLLVEDEDEVEVEDGDRTSLPAGDYGWLTVDVDPLELMPDAMPTIAVPTVALPVDEPEAAHEPEKKKRRSLNPELKLPKLERKPKREKQPKEPRAKKEKQPKEKNPTPIWKRELKLSKPKLERTPKAKTKNATPFWKRELTPKAPKGGAPAKGAIIGLKIGASQVTAARVSNGSSPQLLQVARVPLPDGVVVGGELRDIEALSQALKELFTKNKLPKRGVRLGIANNRIGVRTFEIAGIDEPRQLANAIRFRAQETLPIPLEEAVVDWQILSESKDEESGQVTRRVLLVVAYRELVDRYVLACKKAGLRLQGIDLEAFAMLRALSAPPAAGDDTPPAGAQVVVNVGHDRSTFAVSDGRMCEFTRVLGWGGQTLSVAIARALDMTPSQVRPIKHALSLVAMTEPPEGFTAAALSTARDAVVRELQGFARELVSSLRFYQNQPGSLGIAEVVLTGGTAHLPGFADELNRLIGVPVKVGDPLNRIAVPKKFQTPDDASVGSLTVAIGLGIED